MKKYLIRTDYGVLYGKDGYAILPIHRRKKTQNIDEGKCFSSEDEAYKAAKDITDHRYEIVNVTDLSVGGIFCPHCGRDYPHQHIVDKKGFVHTTILQEKQK